MFVRLAAIGVLSGLLSATPSLSQIPAAPVDHVRALERLLFLTGQWEGEGAMDVAPGQRYTFTSREKVRMHLDGILMTIEGIHYAPGTDGRPGPKVHHAFATVRYEPARKDYSLRATRLDGATIDARGQLQDDAFVWGFEDPRAGHLRYTIRVGPDGRWTERGERSPDGTTWHPFFEMTLQRVTP